MEKMKDVENWYRDNEQRMPWWSQWDINIEYQPMDYCPTVLVIT